MKKLLVVFLFLVAARAGFAQSSVIKAGTVSLGGRISYTHERRENHFSTSAPQTLDEGRNSFYVAPSLGYAVADNLIVGLSLSYISDKWLSYSPSNQPTSTNHNQSLSVGPFATYYRMLSEKFGLAGTLGAGYTRYWSKTYDINSPNAYGANKGNGLYANLIPSLVFFPIPKLALSASLGGLDYSQGSSETDNYIGSGTSTGSASIFRADFGLNYFALGGTYFFGH
jgi:hypothetical protein